MEFDGTFGNVQCTRNFLVGNTLAEKIDDLSLARRNQAITGRHVAQ